MIFLFSGSFCFWWKSSGQVCPGHCCFHPKWTAFVLFFSLLPPCLISFEKAPVSGGLYMQILFNSHFPPRRPTHTHHSWQIPAGPVSQQHWDIKLEVLCTEAFRGFGLSWRHWCHQFLAPHHSTWVLPLQGSLLLRAPMVALLTRCCIVATLHEFPLMP